MLDLEIENVFEQIWGHLDDGLRPGTSVFGMAQLATVGLQGAPKVRAVIVRQVSKSSRKLAFTTDARSSKVAEIKNHPAVALSFYDRELGLQFRFEGVASIVNNGERTDAAWKRNSPLALERYRSDVAPGVAIDAPADAYASSTENRSGREGYENFCVVTFKPTTIDWLNISPDGHRRALFNFADSSWHGACYHAPEIESVVKPDRVADEVGGPPRCGGRLAGIDGACMYSSRDYPISGR